jgi:Zn finger protein HypA/HybF involved in hydrogenase expression
MKLRFGKGSWLELEHMPLESAVEHGMRVFAPAATRAASPRVLVDRGRAAAVANRAVRQAFEKWVPETASVKERKEIAGDKVRARCSATSRAPCEWSIANSSSGSSRLRRRPGDGL